MDVPEDAFVAIIEIPKGSRNKYEYDHELHAIKLFPGAQRLSLTVAEF